MTVVIPEPQAVIDVDQLTALESAIIERLPTIDDTDQLTDMLARAQALETYLRSQAMQAPARAIARRIEVRIGELLGEPYHGPVLPHEVTPNRRHEFRRLAAAAAEGRIEDWAVSRRALLQQVNGTDDARPRVTAADEFALLLRRLARINELLDGIDMRKAGRGGRHSASHDEALRRVARVTARLDRFREEMETPQ